MLELQHLGGLDATARLQIFFDLVEQCSPYDEARIRIAQGRVSPELAVLIHSHQATLQTWIAFQDFFRTEFAVEVNVDRAWQELENLHYEWTEASQAFTSKFICHHAMLLMRFPKEKFPDRDKTIKLKLWQGLPKMSKERLKGFLEDGYPLQKVTARLERERLYLEASNGPNIYRVPEQKDTPETIPSPPTEVTVSKEEVENLRKQISEIKTTLLRSSTRRPPMQVSQEKPGCPYCRANNHSLPECWRAPPPGHCFDCRRLNCHRGYSQCPGRNKPTSPKSDTASQSPAPSAPQA